MSETTKEVLAYLGESRAAVESSRVAAKNVAGSALNDSGFRVKKGGKGSKTSRTASLVQGRIRQYVSSLYADQRYTVGSILIEPVSVKKLAGKLHVSAERVLEVADIPTRTYTRRVTNKEKLTSSESDRVMRIARVAREAERVFGDAQRASSWLETYSPLLGAKPLDLLATDAGSQDVTDELVRIDYGDYA